MSSWKLVMGSWTLTALAALLLPAPLAAQAAPEPPAAKVSVSGYVQPRYDRLSDGGTTTDKAFLRRAVLSIEADLAGPWDAELQVDAGPPASEGERLLVKNALIRYTGWEARGVTIALGNQKVPFSQSGLQSASRRNVVERPFTGSSEFGAPGRSIALAATGWHRQQTIRWTAALASVRHSPDADLVAMEGITRSEEDWRQGPALFGRLEFHPLGEVPRAQGDFERSPLRVVFAAAAYRWSNDDDVPSGAGAVDVNSVSGLEVSGGLRRAGLNIDAEYQRIAARADDRRTLRGIFMAGHADLDKASLEAGYMLLVNRIEITGAVDWLDTGAFQEPWRRAAVGMNWYVNGHALKFSLLHRQSFNDRGIDDVRSRATYLQSQFAF